MSRSIDRRRFIKVAGAAGVFTIVGNGGPGLPLTAWGAPGDGGDTVLVSLSLRGAADGLNILCPFGDPDYYRQRRSYGLQRAEFADLDGFFGLNRDFIDVTTLFRQGHASFVHATGIPAPERSHFKAQTAIDYGMGADGWLQRVIGASSFASDRAGLSIGDRTHAQLVGPNRGTSISTVDEAAEAGADIAVVRPALEALYMGPKVPALERGAVLDAFATFDDLADIEDPDSYFPDSPEALAFRQAATLINADQGVRAVALNSGDWDHHTNGASRLRLRGRVLGRALTSFLRDLGENRGRVIVVVSSEFGRTVQPNGSGGTDHGWGTMMMVIGERLQGQGGGRVFTPGGWPGLATGDLHDGRDLRVTTDFRSVYAELAERHLGVRDMQAVFPGLDRQEVGLLRPQVIGDVDGSGAVTNADVQALMKQNVEGRPASPLAADVDGDGDVDLRDALKLAQQLDN